MKLKFDVCGKNQPDPFIFEDGGKFYLYVTADDGVEAYSADDIFGVWHYEGIVTRFAEGKSFWAPSVIFHEGKYYMYVSCEKEGSFQFLHVARADSPLGPFTDEKCLYNEFSIDSHVVKTSAGLFLFLAMNNSRAERIGTRVYVDRLLDPYTPEGKPAEKILPSFDEELFTPNCTDTFKWHTVEGPFWFCEGEWQYLMYSGGCYQDDTYHIGYAAAKSSEPDLKTVSFEKHTVGGAFAPVIIKNSFEEGTGHHSIIKHRGEYYAIYHGRDYGLTGDTEYTEHRNARICRLIARDGLITAERFEDKI